ncbi:hypothetical protein ACVWZ4_006807 [Bradyrhizobium sp. USDA 4472]
MTPLILRHQKKACRKRGNDGCERLVRRESTVGTILVGVAVSAAGIFQSNLGGDAQRN